jgi:hypothetical protein
MIPIIQSIIIVHVYWGNDIDSLVTEAMKYVIRCRDFYEHDIRENLIERGYAIISSFSCVLPDGGLFVYYDPQNKISQSDLDNLSFNEINYLVKTK